MSAIKRKHQQLFDILKDEFEKGLFPKGSKLPKVVELAQKHSVSVNIATKAVELLKEAGYVVAKAGDGIYSEIDAEKKNSEAKYAGEWLFSDLWMVKQISVCVEDTQDWQQKFWRAFFESFAKRNPDIGINVRFGLGKKPREEYDLLIGGFHFLNASGFTLDDMLESSRMDMFYPDAYADATLKPEDIAWKREARAMPLSFQMPLIVNKCSDYSLNGAENVLDFIERNGSPALYKSWSIQNFLVNSGIKCFSHDNGEFEVDDRDKWQTVISRIKKMFDQGDILPLHGAPIDYEKLFTREMGKSVNYVEVPLNQKMSIGASGLNYSPYPIGDIFPLIPICGMVNKNSLYPEECFRIINSLLSSKVQEDYFKGSLGFPINKSVIEKSDYAYLLERFENAEKALVTPPDLNLDKAIESIFIWELFYYFCGKLNGDIITRIEKKVEFFIENIKRRSEL